MSQSNDSCMLPTNLNLSIPEFFSKYNVNDWTFENYEKSFAENDTQIPTNSVVKKYNQDLNKILANKNVPRSMKNKVGDFLKNSVESTKRKGKATSNNSMIVGINNGTMIYGDMTINHQGANPAKKQKIDHVDDESSSWNIDNDEDIWDAIRQYLDSYAGHEFCLERYHVIECGYSIKCKPNVPEELYFYVSTSDHSVTTPFRACTKYTSDVLTTMTSNDIKAVKKVVRNSSYEGNSSTDVLNFVEEFFELCISIYKKTDLYNRLQISESSFNHSFVWPIMGFAADSVNGYNLKFIPGEYILMASKETNKVDACIINDGMEICLLETSGKLLLRDNTKYGFDHIKSNFGSLNIFNNIYKKYHWASKETAGRLRIPFVHARHDEIHLWSLELCSSKLYCSKKVFKCVVPKAMSDANDILALGNFCWCLTSALRDASETVQAMKNEHNQYEVERVLSCGDNRVPLNQLVNSDIKKPTEGCGFGILIPEEKEEAEYSVFLKNPN